MLIELFRKPYYFWKRRINNSTPKEIIRITATPITETKPPSVVPLFI